MDKIDEPARSGLTQQTRGIYPKLFQCWHTVFDAGPTLEQHWVNAPCLLGDVVVLCVHRPTVIYEDIQ